MLNLKDIRYFAAIARHPTLSEAAAALGVSQPALSLAVKRFEDVARRPLLVRTPGQGIKLTPFGKAVLKAAKDVLRGSDMLDSLMRPDRLLRGELVVDCFEDLAPFCLAPIVAGLQGTQPDLVVTPAEFGLAALAERARLGISDVAISYDVAIPSGLHVIPLHALDVYDLLPETDPLAAEEAIGLAQLGTRTFMLSSHPESAEHFLGLFRFLGLPIPAYRAVRTFELQRSLIANGLGCGLGYTRPAGDMSYDGRRIRCVPLTDSLPRQHILAILQRPPLEGSAEAAFVAQAWDFFS
jgi:DNA-binding transcriptional LysR family regulator